MPSSSVWMSAPLATVAAMIGWIVVCCTLASRCKTLPDLRAGSGREWVACPSPACPGPARRPACDGARTAPFGYSRRLALVAGHHVTLIDLHLTLQPSCWDFGHEATAQMFRHGLHVGRAQAQLQGDLPVREVQAHEVEAQHPHPQRLMVSGQRRAGEVVKAPGAGLTAIALPMRLGVVAPVPDYRTAAAAGAAHALGPAMLAHQREAFGVVQQPREVDQFRCRHDRPGSLRGAADQRPPHSSQQKPRATATRSSAPQHPETREEPRKIGWDERGSPPPFRPALTILGSVISRPVRERAVVDVGWKAASSDAGPPEVFGRDDLVFEFAGDEHGTLVRVDGGPLDLRLGDTVRLLPSHCDTTVNLYSAYTVHRGDRVEAVWPVTARGCSR